MLATEFQIGGKELGFAFLAWNLLAGVIGYFFFTLLGLPVFAQSIPFTPISTLKLAYALYAILLGLVGALLTLLIAVSFQVFGRVMGRFGDRVVLRTIVAGVVIAIVVFFFPQLMFAGVDANLPNDPKSSPVWCGDVAALCAAEDPAAGAVVQEWVPGWPDLPDLVLLHDGCDGAEPDFPGHSSVHSRAVH